MTDQQFITTRQVQTLIQQFEGVWQIVGAKISYPHLYEAHAVVSKGQQPQPNARKTYGCQLLVPPTTDINAFWGAMQAAAAEKFPEGLPQPFNWPIRQLGTNPKDDPQFKGWYQISAKRAESQGKPHTVDGTQTDITDPGVIYAGCVVNAVLSIYAYDNIAKGVNCGLEGIMFRADSEHLDNRLTKSQMFGGMSGGVPNMGMGPANMQPGQPAATMPGGGGMPGQQASPPVVSQPPGQDQAAPQGDNVVTMPGMPGSNQ